MTRSQMPKDFENLEFESIDEKWNEYELQNGTTIRGRIIVTRFFKDPNNPNPNTYSLNSKNIFVVNAPIEQRGDPNTAMTQAEVQNPKGVSVEIINSNERWNKFRILKTGLVLKVKMIVSDAIRLDDKYDTDYMPRYIFKSTAMIVPDQNTNPNVRT